MSLGTSLAVWWLRLYTPNAGDLGSIPNQGTISHMLQLRVCMPQLKILSAKTKTRHSQINNFFKKEKKENESRQCLVLVDIWRTLKHCLGEYSLGQLLWKTLGQYLWTYLREMHADGFQNGPR